MMSQLFREPLVERDTARQQPLSSIAQLHARIKARREERAAAMRPEDGADEQQGILKFSSAS